MSKNPITKITSSWYKSAVLPWMVVIVLVTFALGCIAGYFMSINVVTDARQAVTQDIQVVASKATAQK